MGKPLHGKLQRKGKRFKGSPNSNGSSHNEHRKTKHVTGVHLVRTLLCACGLASILWNVGHFHFNVHLENEVDHAGAALKRAFFSPRRTSSNSTKPISSNNLQQYQRTSVTLPPQVPPPQARSQLDLDVPLNQGNIPTPKEWDVPSVLDDKFDKVFFEQRLASWREHQKYLRQERYQRWIRHAAQHPGEGTNSTMRIIPYLQQTPVFPRQMSGELMVLVMADNQCPLVQLSPSLSSSEKGVTIKINATARLLATLGDVLETDHATVVAYLPHYYQEEAKECHDVLYQAVVTTFPKKSRQGKLHVVTSPRRPMPSKKQHRQVYRFATNGLDFAYAAELGYQYSDLMLFLQAGTRLLPRWWNTYVRVDTEAPETPPPPNTTLAPKIEIREVTANRDYGFQVLSAYEQRHRLDGDGLTHDLCYMNFANNVAETEAKELEDGNTVTVKKNYIALENPTGALFESKHLLRMSLALRSFLPYGKFAVSKLLDKYCRDMLWAPDMLDAPIPLFRYDAKGQETNTPLELQSDLQPIENSATTYPYLTPSSAAIPDWVTVDATTIGPHPVNEANPLLKSLDGVGGGNKNGGSDDKYWMTFVVPTAWRHTTKDMKGNAYVVDCLQQLSDIVKQYFKGEHRAMILVLVSGQNLADIDLHRKGLQAAFEEQIQSGIIKLVDAPIQQYPTLHGLNANYKDPEPRVRWRSKQNLDISSAFYAAKGYGKYIMMIEDDSSFRAGKMFSNIEKSLSGIHLSDNPNDAVDHSPKVIVDGEDKSKYKISYNQEKEPAVTEMGHREVWSQYRFSFGYSGVLIHDEDAYVYAMMHFLLYQERPCDLLFEIAKCIRNGKTKDHFLRFNIKNRFIMHQGKVSSLEGKVFSDKAMQGFGST